MKISSLGSLGCALALAAGSAFANVTPNLQDSSGAAVKDGSGACVVTSGQVLPECAGVRAGEWLRRRVRRVRIEEMQPGEKRLSAMFGNPAERGFDHRVG